jgi:hypothetical protein
LHASQVRKDGGQSPASAGGAGPVQLAFELGNSGYKSVGTQAQGPCRLPLLPLLLLLLAVERQTFVLASDSCSRCLPSSGTSLE